MAVSVMGSDDRLLIISQNHWTKTDISHIKQVLKSVFPEVKQPDSLLYCWIFFFSQVTQKSGAHVRVLSDSGEPGCKTAVCFLLQGSKEQVLLARCVLENLVIDCEPVTEALEVPQTAFGRIIGSF